MRNRRVSLMGLPAVMLALLMQLGFGARVPANASLISVMVICRADAAVPVRPWTPDHHDPGCPVCPLCAAAHTGQPALVPVVAGVSEPRAVRFTQVGLPWLSILPPSRVRPPTQPRAPPTVA